MNIFEENKIYSFGEIVDICNVNSLTTVDCLKDENMISVEGWDDKEKCLVGECLFEFNRIKEDRFSLRWSIFADKTCKQTARF